MTTFTGHLTDAQAQRLVDGALFPDEAAEVEAHASTCAECEAVVLSFRALGEALGELELPELPLDFTQSVMAEIDDRERAAARERRWAWGIVGAVLAVLVAVAAFTGWAWMPNAAQVADGTSSAMRTLRLGADVLAPVLSAMRLQIAAVCAALLLPFVYLLSRLMPSPSPRTEIA